MQPSGQRKTFRRHEHLRSPNDFRRVYERKRSVSDAGLIVYACENGLGYSRLGMSVSRKVGSAVVRNRLRRLFREAFRLGKSELPTGLDLVLIPRSSEVPVLDDLQSRLAKLARQVAGRLARETRRP